MKLVYQKYDYDCLKAAYSTLLGIDYDDIPDFSEGEDWSERLDAWLDKIGYRRVVIGFEPLNGFLHINNKMFVIGVLKKSYKNNGHCVVLEIEDCKINIFHDPLGDTTYYDIYDLRYVEIISKYK